MELKDYGGLLTNSNPENYTEEELENYTQILIDSDTVFQNYDPTTKDKVAW